MSRLLEDLNPDQREAVTTTDGPLLIVAGAGSGKTRVLTRRLAYILTQRLAEPFQLLAVTFTNKAAGEMRERVDRLLGTHIDDLNVRTFHSFCARLLRREGQALGYDPQFTIFDADDSRTLTKNCIKELNLSGSQFSPRAQLSKISSAKNKLISAEAFERNASGYFETTTSRIYSLYQSRLRECDAMDFDDLLFNTVVLLRDHPEVGERYRRRFKYVMVDEYQDTNHVQYLLLKLLVDDHKNICVVGDEDQSIYGWRGADIRNILDFEKDFDGAKIIKLEQNYRSTPVILQAASTVIKNNTTRKEKALWTDQQGGDKVKLVMVDSAEEEAREMIDIIESSRTAVPLRETAILYRTNAQSRPFEEHLRRRGIPYQIVGGISFYQRKEIKDLLAYMRLIVNPKDDISFARIVNYPKRGIGAKSISDLSEIARVQGKSLYEAAKDAGTNPELASRGKKLQKFAALIEGFREKAETSAIDLLAEDIVEEIGFLNELKSEDEIIGQTRVENVEALIEGMAQHAHSNPDATLADYLAEISLFTDIDAYADTDDKVTLMTLHAAKGLEFDSVYIVGLEEGLFPLGRTVSEPMELEEERRLFYVGATRARRQLTLSAAMSRHRFGVVESIPSRFIKELPDELLDTVDNRTNRYYESETATTPVGKSMSFFGSAPQAKKARSNEMTYGYEGSEHFREGRIVQHPSFGRGKIVKSEGFGESLRLEIMFSGIGLKKILAKYARLKVIG